jgi:colicin import membrane protein
MKALALPQEAFQRYLAISAGLHIALLLAYSLKIAIFPSDIIMVPDAIRIDMIGLPDKIQTQPKAAPKAAPPVEIAPAKPEPKAKPDVKTKDLKSEQKKALNALKQLEAMEALKAATPAKVSDQSSDLKPSLPEYKGNAVTSGNSFTGISGLVAQEYWSVAKQHVHNFWALPEWLANLPLRASVVVLIDASGKVVKSEIYKTSGNSAFDNASLTAVEAASPFPVPPEKIRDTVIKSWMIFNFPD